MSLDPLALPPTASGSCLICSSTECTHAPVVDYLDTYPFLPGGRPKVAGIEGTDYVIAPHAVADAVLERNVYGAGDRVPMVDAVKYGLIEAPAAPKTAARAKKGPAEDRAKKGPAEDR